MFLVKSHVDYELNQRNFIVLAGGVRRKIEK